MHTKFQLRNLNGRYSLGDVDIDRYMILKFALNWVLLTQDKVFFPELKHDNEPTGSIKCEKFFD